MRRLSHPVLQEFDDSKGNACWGCIHKDASSAAKKLETGENYIIFLFLARNLMKTMCFYSFILFTKSITISYITKDQHDRDKNLQVITILEEYQHHGGKHFNSSMLE